MFVAKVSLRRQCSAAVWFFPLRSVVASGNRHLVQVLLGLSELITTSPRYGVAGLLKRRRAQCCPGSRPSAELAVSDLKAA